MRMAAPHHHGMGLVRLVEIVGIAAMALHQDGVFLARHRLPDGVFHKHHGRSLPSRNHCFAPV
jgi:hypothetical protein